MPGPRLNAAFYADSVAAFLRASDDEVYAPLASPHGYTLAPEQLSAWRLQLPVLRAALADLVARAEAADPVASAPWIHLEFDIPRLGRRVDAVLVTSTAVIPIEFKVGAKKFQQADYEQAWDYGLDLKNFHAPSHAAAIFPILCATDAPKSDRRWKPPHADGVRPPFRWSAAGLGTAIAQALAEVGAAPAPITPSTWGTGSYSPTPTIIEAARSLYARHTVHDITRSDAGAVNLAVTSAAVERIIAGARERRRKAIVFVTGVPGAGKTLVGLNVATRHGSRDDAAHAVFLSGNGPLVAVLREALARDDLDRAKLTDPRARIGTSRTAVRAFIQNVHHFRDATLRDPAAPADHVVVFDEAQRAWDARQLASFMKRKKGLPGFTQTEPELLIGAMERHADWAVVVCLVGGGQEINTGEAGISAWLDGVRTLFPGWDVFISPHLTDSEYAASGALERLREAKLPATPFDEEKVSATLSAAETVADTFSGLLTPSTWGTGSYSPTPTIIEAARSLYARHTVHDITRSDAGAVNLAATSGCIERIITAAKAGRRKAIVFVTGVPGAGKTLVGLNVATRHGERSDAAHAVFLSGNGPPPSHHFRDDTLRDPAPPDDHVVVFDEAQRAWDARQLASC